MKYKNKTSRLLAKLMGCHVWHLLGGVRICCWNSNRYRLLINIFRVFYQNHKSLFDHSIHKINQAKLSQIHIFKTTCHQLIFIS